MKSIHLFIALSLSACIVVTDTDGRLAVTWELRDDTGAEVGCIDGEEVVIDAAGFRSRYACSSGSAVSGLLPVGDYSVAIELHAVDGTTVVYRNASVFSRATTDVGHIIFSVASAAPGSATITWDLHQYSLDAPAEGCQVGETIYIEVAGIDAFTVDCALYNSQQIIGLAPGTYDAYVALRANGSAQDDPRPGYGFTELTIEFDVLAGADTLVPVDFVVQASNTRDAARQVGEPAPSRAATCLQTADSTKCLPQRAVLSTSN